MRYWIIKAVFKMPPAEATLDRILNGFIDQATKAELIATGSCDNVGMEFVLRRDDGTSDYTFQVVSLVAWLQLQPEVISVSSEQK